MDKPLLSVACITYNHRDFIEESLESFLMQETDFPFEILIGEDCSTDGTREIAFDYEKKHQGKIKVITSEHNVGRVTNILRVKDASQGKYIALCEGDDYWSDPLKLQKQVDFLEKNEEFAACAHLSNTKYDFEVEKERQFYLEMPKNSVMKTRDFLDKIPFHTSSIVFRKSHTDKLHQHSDPALVRDHPLMILLSSSGPIKVLPDVMSVYRKNKGGISENISIKMIYEANIETANALKEVLPGFGFKAAYLKGLWSRYYLLKGKDLSFPQRTGLFFKYVFGSFYKFPKNIKPVLYTIKLLFNGN
jgi:glycosyltransferase involved in cell wall biosynthesis